jgi:hypothetical protein
MVLNRQAMMVRVGFRAAVPGSVPPSGFRAAPELAFIAFDMTVT